MLVTSSDCNFASVMRTVNDSRYKSESGVGDFCVIECVADACEKFSPESMSRSFRMSKNPRKFGVFDRVGVWSLLKENCRFFDV